MEQVAIVRCKNCVYSSEAILHKDHRMICDKRGLIVVEPDFYCADGEEIDKGENNVSEES